MGMSATAYEAYSDALKEHSKFKDNAMLLDEMQTYYTLLVGEEDPYLIDLTEQCKSSHQQVATLVCSFIFNCQAHSYLGKRIPYVRWPVCKGTRFGFAILSCTSATVSQWGICGNHVHKSQVRKQCKNIVLTHCVKSLLNTAQQRSPSVLNDARTVCTSLPLVC